MSNYVYAIVNKINLKLYFGSHSWEGTGLDPNYYGSGKIIKQAIKKYGKDNFIVYPIQFYNNVDECRRAEEQLLNKYNIADNPYCYNIKNGAIGWTSEDMTGEKHPNYGKHPTEETRKKMSQAQKGKKHTEETRNKMSQAHKGKNKGKTFSEEHRKKLSEVRKGRTLSDATRQKISQINKGKTVSEETKKKMSQATNYKKTPIVAIQIATGKVKIFESQSECSRVLGIHVGSVNSCLKGKSKTCKGYSFKYVEELESGIYEGIL